MRRALEHKTSDDQQPFEGMAHNTAVELSR
jgi:hypothetical protein